MPIIHKCAQYSDEYDRLRLGIPTASKFDKIITPTGKPVKEDTWQKYAHHLIAERIIGYPVQTYSSPYMETALMMESDAVEYYETLQGVNTETVGFITDDEKTVGCSPDRFIGADGLLEIKCPQPQTQVGYYCKGNLAQDYMPQLQGQLFVSGREWVDICAYHPLMKPVIVRVERDVEYIACLEARLKEFNDFVARVTDRLTIQPKEGKKNGSQEIQF